MTKKLNVKDNYGNFHRVLIFNFLKKKNMSVTELSEQLNDYPRVAVDHHLKKLKEWKLVKRLPADKMSVGYPVKWKATLKAPPHTCINIRMGK